MAPQRLSLPVLKEKPGFCVLPWLHVSASVDGVWGRCCLDSSMYYDFYYAKQEEPEFILRKDAIGCSPKSKYADRNPEKALNLLDAFNSEEMKKTRLAMLNGEMISACQYCFECEAGGGESQRQRMNEIYGNLPGVPELIERTEEDGHLDAFPFYLDLRFGNTCNLKCVMCRFPVSSAWGTMTKWSKSKIDPFVDDPELWELLKENVTKIKVVYFAGGEPFLQPLHFKMLDLLIESGHAKNVYVAYNTNLTVLPPGIFDKLAQFADVTIGASCDGTGEVFEAIRSGARWETFARNVRTAKQHAKLKLSVTVQKDNLANLEELVEWAYSEGVSIDMTNILMQPSNLSVRNIPLDEKQQLKERYEEVIGRYMHNGRENVARELKMILDFMWS